MKKKLKEQAALINQVKIELQKIILFVFGVVGEGVDWRVEQAFYDWKHLQRCL